MKLTHNDRYGFETLLSHRLGELCKCGISVYLPVDKDKFVVSVWINNGPEKAVEYLANGVKLSIASMTYLVQWAYMDRENMHNTGNGFDLWDCRWELVETIDKLALADKQEAGKWNLH